MATTKKKKKKKNIYTMTAYADMGSHQKIFMFSGGEIAEKYPTLLHIYLQQITPDLVPITITYEIK